MSLPEVLLWQCLRGSPGGLAFRKQHPIDPYVADFYCSASRLVIEVDGQAHERGDRPERDDARAAFLQERGYRPERDDARAAFLQERGYRILRVPAADVLKNPAGVADSIVAYAADPLHHRAARGGPPPRPGEDWR